jgi:hypothetical protein
VTPSERQQLTAQIERLNEAAQSFRTSRDQVHSALVALVEANEAGAAAIDKVIKANLIALDLLHSEAGQ